MPETIILPWGRIEYGNNEVSIISTVDDPPGVRLAKSGSGSLGKISFGRLRSDGVQEEAVLIQGKLDERYPGQLVGYFDVHLQRPPTGGTDDADMVRVATFKHDRIEFHVPVTGLPAPNAKRVAFRAHANGKLVCAEAEGTQPLIANRDAIGGWETFDLIEF